MGLAVLRSTFAAGALAVGGVGAAAPDAEAQSSYFVQIEGTVTANSSTASSVHIGDYVSGDGQWTSTFDSAGSPTVGLYLGSGDYANFYVVNEFGSNSITGIGGNSSFVDVTALSGHDSITLNNYTIDSSSGEFGNMNSIYMFFGNSGPNILLNDSFAFDQSIFDSFINRQLILFEPGGQITVNIDSFRVYPVPAPGPLLLAAMAAGALATRRRRDDELTAPAAATTTPSAAEIQGPSTPSL